MVFGSSPPTATKTQSSTDSYKPPFFTKLHKILERGLVDLVDRNVENRIKVASRDVALSLPVRRALICPAFSLATRIHDRHKERRSRPFRALV
jgi:hypothetical protein